MVFQYLENWLEHILTPLYMAQSLPLRRKRFNRKECRGYFGGILPEEAKREISARNLGISPRNDYAMLERIRPDSCRRGNFHSGGEGLAGAQ